MQNSISIRFDTQNGRFFISIDGKERFELGTECLEDSILARATSTQTDFSMHRESESERIISYGFCTEYCCPSTSAKVTFNGPKVFWTNIRHPIAKEDPTSYEFDRDQYEAEINRVLLELIDFQSKEFTRISAKLNPPRVEQ